MGYYLDWYRRLVCEAEGHTHGEEGELDCILLKFAQVRAAETEVKCPAKSSPQVMDHPPHRGRHQAQG
jgi:hypothetical protein